ncbi:hypothetical protein [Hymenobacter sp. UYCo722]|uniref:hypothetical protein n=1 Tax=Hymenobacter sp. UYCo722 TaxID=3156335 RepID=UPI00339B03E4
MLMSSTMPDTDGSRCILTLDEEGWLRATWRGFVDPIEAFDGADNYLRKLAELHCAYLLNDNSTLTGPWFDSVDWLERVWVPQSRQLGLRYVAHVVQADALSDTITTYLRGAEVGGLVVQIFQQVSEAEAWLRHCQLVEAGVE